MSFDRRHLTPESNLTLTYAHNRESIFRELVKRGATAEEIAQAVYLPVEEVKKNLDAQRPAAICIRTAEIANQLWADIVARREWRGDRPDPNAPRVSLAT